MSDSSTTYDKYTLEFQTDDDRSYFEGDEPVYTLHGPPFWHHAHFTEPRNAAGAYFAAAFNGAEDIRLVKQRVTVTSSDPVELSAEDVMAMRRIPGRPTIRGGVRGQAV